MSFIKLEGINRKLPKSFSSIVFSILLMACQKDEVITIEKIVAGNNYTIELSFVGDFGRGTETIEVAKDGLNSQATYTYLDYSKPDGPHKKKKSITWGNGKDILVREIFLFGVTLKKDSLLHCTQFASYRLKDFPNNVGFDDRSCLVTEKYQALLK